MNGLRGSSCLSGLLCVLFFLLPGTFLPPRVETSHPVELIKVGLTPVRKTSELAKLNLEDHNLAFIGARSFYAIDLDSGSVLAAKNENQVFYPASTTKMMTALVAREHYTLEEVLIVPLDIEKHGNGMGLEPAESIVVRDVLYGLLIPSGNDAAFTLAQNYPGGESAFVAKMNQKAQQLHLDSTHFDNPAGFDSENQSSSARDLVILARELLKDGFLQEVVSQAEKTVTDTTGVKVHQMNSTNRLLGVVEGVKGVKTGTTLLAGEVLVTQVERDGHQIIIALLASKDRFSETSQIIDWVFSNYEWI